MWSTIENFKESLSQITADVLDAAEELEPGGSELSTDGLEDSSHRQRRIHSPDTHHSQVIFIRSEISFFLICHGIIIWIPCGMILMDHCQIEKSHCKSG